MVITWRATPVVFSRGTAEPQHLGLEALEREVQLFVTVAAAEIAASRLGRSAQDNASSSLFLLDMEQLEGRFRTVLVDPALTESQNERLTRARDTYRQLLPIRRLRNHVELPMRLLEEHNAFIRFELARAAEAVAWLGKKAVLAVREPDTLSRQQFQETEEMAQAALLEATRRLQTVLSPYRFCVVRASLLALDVAREGFVDILERYTRGSVAEPLGVLPL